MILSTGIRCVDRLPKTIDRTLQSSRQAGLLDDVCVFADSVSGDYLPAFQGQLIQREPRAGAWPNFFLSLAEMYLRRPEADLYLLLEDDVVFCRNIRPYLETVYSGLEVASLFTSAKVERWISQHGVGFHRQNPGWNVSSGGQAWIFSNQRLRDFLRSEFVVNYRKSPPKDLNPKHYRKDGLYHTDSVVGQFCREAGCGIQYHYPSLAQHIGDHSFMFPDLTRKRDIRFSEHFPGEEFSAMDLTPGDAVMHVKSSHAPASCAILVPAQGAIEPECERSLRALEQRGYAVRRVYGYAAIDQGRNQMATDALREGFAETMWIDSDIAFNPDDVDKLREHNLPICSAIYPKKGQRKLASHVLPGTEKIVFGKEKGTGGLFSVGFARVPKKELRPLFPPFTSVSPGDRPSAP